MLFSALYLSMNIYNADTVQLKIILIPLSSNIAIVRNSSPGMMPLSKYQTVSSLYICLFRLL